METEDGNFEQSELPLTDGVCSGNEAAAAGATSKNVTSAEPPDMLLLDMLSSLIKGQKEIKEEVVANLENVLKTEIQGLRSEVDIRMQAVQSEIKANKNEIDRMKELCHQMQQNYDELRNHTSAFAINNSTSKYRVKPPSFDGKISWATYFKQFEAAAVANEWDESEKAVALVVALRGDALNVLECIPEDKQNSYTEIVSALEARFGDKHLQQVYQAQLKGRQQKQSETLQEYEVDIARLVRLAYPTASEQILEQLSIQLFVDGIHDLETQQAVRLGNRNTLTETLAYALQFEAAKQATRNQVRARQVNILEDNSSLQTIDVKLDKLCSFFSDKERHSTLKSPEIQRRGYRDQNRRCWSCGSWDHFEAQCSRRNAFRSQWRNSNERRSASRERRYRSGSNGNQGNDN